MKNNKIVVIAVEQNIELLLRFTDDKISVQYNENAALKTGHIPKF